MKLRITRSARADICELFAYIEADSAKAAQTVVDRILAAMQQLPERPQLGHIGRDPTTLELVVKRTSYVAVYRIEADTIVVLRLRHGAQQRDPAP